jgi:hypothetical protein
VDGSFESCSEEQIEGRCSEQDFRGGEGIDEGVKCGERRERETVRISIFL